MTVIIITSHSLFHRWTKKDHDMIQFDKIYVSFLTIIRVSSALVHVLIQETEETAVMKLFP